MKKKVVIVASLFASLMVTAQEPASEENAILKNKKGYEILPKKGDIGLGFNTIPILDMFLGTLNRATPFAGSSNVVQYTSNSNNQIFAKYYLDAKTAVRVRFGFNTLSGSMTNQVRDAKAQYDASFGTNDDITKAALLRVDDKLNFRKSNWVISVGYEKRRGYRRLQGFYGAELGFGSTASSQRVEYGNAFSDKYPSDFTNNFNSFGVTSQNPIGNGRTVRNLTATNRAGFRVGVRGFVGIEYFIFSKISIGVEYGWGYSVSTRSGVKSTQEVYNNGQKGPETYVETVDTDSSERLKGFSVDNNNGSVFSLNNTLGGNTALSGGAGALTLIFHF
jgi:hypothetical protein